MIRYEIKTSKAGVIIDASLVKSIISTKAMKVPTVIVFVEKKNQRAFEKYVEGLNNVLSYRADPRSANVEAKDWTR